LVAQKFIKTLFKKIIFNYYTTSFNSLWIFNQHKQFIHFYLFLLTFQNLENFGMLHRWHPASRCIGDLLLPHLVLVGEALYAHLQNLHQGAVKELGSAEKMQQWWRRKGNELVNSNSPIIPLIKRPGEGTWAATWWKKRKR
jgi:hypothetical protein